MYARYVTATVGQTTYRIPAVWLMSATRNMSYAQAVQWWHEQALMASVFTRQTRKAA